MARVAKIDNAFKKRFERKEKRRSIDTRDNRVYFLIICEGEKTEPNYFIALEKELPIGTVKLEIEGTGRNTIGLVDHAIALRNKANRHYDSVWAVFDKNSFPPENFNGAIIKANANDIKCAWSNEAFELWFLLHFQFINNAMNRNDYKAYLEREIQRVLGNEQYRYEKNSPDTYSLLKVHGNQNQAIIYAKRLTQTFNDERYATHNPCTHVFELIEELLNPKKVLEDL